jgi:hypothetical protein
LYPSQRPKASLPASCTNGSIRTGNHFANEPRY